MDLKLSREQGIADFKGCGVLVYSSDRAFLDRYRATLFSLGFTPVTTTAPEGVMGILRLVIVAFIVVDADGDLDGFSQVLHCAAETQPHTPVVIVSRKFDADFPSSGDGEGSRGLPQLPGAAE